MELTDNDKQPRCRSCRKILVGKNAIDVGYCLPCYAIMMSDFDDEDDFQECADCDGHDACRDFGCAFKLGLGRKVKHPL